MVVGPVARPMDFFSPSPTQPTHAEGFRSREQSTRGGRLWQGDTGIQGIRCAHQADSFHGTQAAVPSSNYHYRYGVPDFLIVRWFFNGFALKGLPGMYE